MQGRRIEAEKSDIVACKVASKGYTSTDLKHESEFYKKMGEHSMSKLILNRINEANIKLFLTMQSRFQKYTNSFRNQEIVGQFS